MKLNFFNAVTFILFFFAATLCAQVNSPYTRIGIGDIVYDYSAKRLGMGQTGASIADNDYINTINPAGLYNLSLTRFETGIKYGGEFISSESEKKFYAKADFNGFTFGFPVSRLYGVGAAIGIVPVSFVNYDVSEQLSSPLGNYNASYKGKGGLSRIFASASYRLPFNLNVGASFDYYFGTMDYSSTVNFIDQDNYNANYNLNYQINGLGTTLGLISSDLSGLLKSETITDFRIGAAVSLISDLSVDTMIVGTSNFAVDTIAGGSTKMKLPYRLSTGISFKLSNNYLISVDYTYQPWQEYSLNSIKSKSLRNASKISAGFEFKPVLSYDKTFWEQIAFRAGLSFEQTQYIINGKGINKFAVSGGLSIPISDVNSISIGLELATRGTKEPGLYKENIYRLNIGLNLGELWFIRQEK